MNTILETTNNGPPGLNFDPPNLSQHRKQARQTAAIDRPDDPGILFGILIRHNPTNPKDLSGGMEGKHGNISELIYLPDFLDQPEYCFNTGLNRRLRQTLEPAVCARDATLGRCDGHGARAHHTWFGPPNLEPLVSPIFRKQCAVLCAM